MEEPRRRLVEIGELLLPEHAEQNHILEELRYQQHARFDVRNNGALTRTRLVIGQKKRSKRELEKGTVIDGSALDRNIQGVVQAVGKLAVQKVGHRPHLRQNRTNVVVIRLRVLPPKQRNALAQEPAVIRIDLVEHARELCLYAIPFRNAQLFAREILLLVVKKCAEQIEGGRLGHHAGEHGSDAQTMQNRRRAILAPPVAVGMVQVAERLEKGRLIRHLDRSQNHAQKGTQIDLARRKMPINRRRKSQVSFNSYLCQLRIVA